MSRIENTFKNLDRTALITFIMASDPSLENSLAALKALPAAGADIIELGMPFTDPVADGPTIQKAGERALKAGGSMTRTLEMVKEFRQGNTDTPIVLMGYANPIFTYGVEDFTKDAAEAGVDGLIIVDLPPEEDEELRGAAKAQNIDLIRLITPTTDEARLKTLLEGASGFLYYVSVAGITGTAKASADDLKPKIESIKAQTDLPVAIGFGIRKPEDAAAMAKIADGVVVGSALVEAMQTSVDTLETEVKNLASAL